MQWFLRVALRLAICLGIAVAAYRMFGPVAVVFCALIFAIALAEPLLHALGRLPYLARLARFRGFHGRYYEFRGKQIVVEEDATGHRWIELKAVREFDPLFPPDARLAVLYPRYFRPVGANGSAFLRAEELVDLLRKVRSAQAIRLRNWIERQVIAPATIARGEGSEKRSP